MIFLIIAAFVGCLGGLGWHILRHAAADVQDSEAEAALRDLHSRYAIGIRAAAQEYLRLAPSDEEWLAEIENRILARGTDATTSNPAGGAERAGADTTPVRRASRHATERIRGITAPASAESGSSWGRREPVTVIPAGTPDRAARPGKDDLSNVTEFTPLAAAKAIRGFNASDRFHEDLWARAHQAGDAVRRSVEEKRRTRQVARQAHDEHLAAQAEHPQRRAPMLLQGIIALLTVAFDGVTCWFAAQALGNGQLETLLWAGLFLAILASGEVALDYFSDRSYRTWRLLVSGLAAFVVGLGVLRFTYLATVGIDGTIAALTGAALFTVVASSFVLIGYLALRVAERPGTWRARRRARRAARDAAAASSNVARCLKERNRLVDAYLDRIRVSLLQTCAPSQLPLMETALRAHLCGLDPSWEAGEDQAEFSAKRCHEA